MQWPSGARDTVPAVDADQIITIEEGKGLVASGCAGLQCGQLLSRQAREGMHHESCVSTRRRPPRRNRISRAHHSFAAEYDGGKPVTVTGTVARIDWQNPHIYLYLDVKDDQGAVAQWKFEGYPPNMLVRQGWKRDATLKVGDSHHRLRLARPARSAPGRRA